MGHTDLRARARRSAKIGSRLLIGGLVALLAAQYLGVRAARAVTFPIDLRPGVTHSPVFHADYDQRYEVNVEVDRSLPFEKIHCLLGEQIPGIPATPGRCSNAPSPLALEWVAFEHGREIARGDTQPGQFGGYGPTITRTIGRVGLRPGHSYQMEIRSLKDASALATTNPRISVEVHPSVWEDEWVIRSLVALISLLVDLFGVTYLLGAAWMWFRSSNPRAA